MLTQPDTSTRLKPEFMVVVDKIYGEMCNLQPGTKVLIISDSRTPRHIVDVFMGMAMVRGAIVSVSENSLAPPPADQPGFEWNPMVSAAAGEADLIVDLAVGYAEFMAKAIERGARIISPGDGTGSYHLEDSLIRTMLHVDIGKLRREAIHYADIFTEGSEIRITSEEGTDLTLNIKGLEGVASHEYLWDPDKQKEVIDWGALPPAAPGMVLPKYCGDGVVAADGCVLFSDLMELPSSPVLLTLERGKIVDVAGEDRICVTRLQQWLASLKDDSGVYGPVHFNLGLNPRAQINEHPEFEKIRGALVFGFGDSSLLVRMWPSEGVEPVVSDVHWDVIAMRPTVSVDGQVICENGVMPEFGG